MKILKPTSTPGLPVSESHYTTDSGEAMMRVWGTVIKEGAQIKCQGHWVLFDKDNKAIDLDTVTTLLNEMVLNLNIVK